MGGLEDIWAVLLVSAIKAEVQIAHEEVDVCNRIRFNHIFLTEQADVFENALGHD